MSGEFTKDSTPMDHASQDINTNKAGTGNAPEGFETDVEGIYADDKVQYGQEEYPVFDISQEEFFSNLTSDRKKLRFKNGSKVMQYKNKTKNSLRPFYIRTTDQNGQSYTRKLR